MTNLYGEQYTEIPSKPRKPVDTQRLAWERGFQRWSDKVSQVSTTHYGKCGYGAICDYCTDSNKGRPCVRALNQMCREKGIKIDYSDSDYERWF